MAKDLRTFLRRLEERAPDELLRVKRPVSVDLELTGKRVLAIVPDSGERYVSTPFFAP